MQQKKEEIIFKSEYVKRLLSITIISLLLFASFSIVFVEKAKAQGSPNSLDVIPSDQNVTIGDSFYTLINVTINWEINNVTISNITFTPGILNYTSTAQGNLFIGGNFDSPEAANISNSSGYAFPISWTNASGTNMTNATVANISWYAYGVGTADINITGMTRNDSGANFTTITQNGTVVIHPSKPSTFIASAINSSVINLTFNKGIGADYTYIERNTSSNWPIEEGVFVDNITGTSLDDTGLTNSTTYHYRAWSWNQTANLYSLQSSLSSNTTTGVNITIQGQVRDAQNNTPIQGATVMIFIEDDGEGLDYQMWQTDADGNFIANLTVQDVPMPGEYAVEVTHQGYVGYRNWSIQLSEGQTVTLDILLEPYFDPANYSIIRGNVTVGGSPLVDGEVMLLDTDLTHMIMGGEGGEESEKFTFTDENGNYSFNITYNSTYILLTFDYGYYADFSNETTIGPDEIKWYNFTLQPAEPDTLDMTIQFTDLDDAVVTVNRTVIAASPVFRFSLDFNPELGDSNQNVSQTEVQTYMQTLGRYGPTFGFIFAGEEGEPAEGDEEMHGPSFLAIPALMALDGSNLTEFVPGSHNGNLDNLVNTSVTSNETIYYNATFNITLDGHILNRTTPHPFNITTTFNSTGINNITFVFGDFYNVSNIQNDTNGNISNVSSSVTIVPGNGSIDAFAYANITLSLNESTVSLPIIEVPTWYITDEWVFNDTENGTTDETTYTVDGKPLEWWDRHRYIIGDENLSYLSYEMRKETFSGSEMLFVTMNDLDWIDLGEGESINYLVNDIDFPIYNNKSWSTVSWWGEPVNATVISCSDSKLTGDGTFSCVKINYTNATSATVGQEWYSPEVKFFVNRTKYYDGGNTSILDLIGYLLAPYIESLTAYANDSDSDGLYNSLDVNVTINTSGITTPTDYIIEGPFVKEPEGWGHPVDIMFMWEEDQLRELNNSVNSKTITLSYSGGLINASGVDGPYTGWLNLREASEGGHERTIDSTSFEADYNHTDFQSPALTIISIEDYGNDTGSNGKYDYLTVNVTVNVSESGTYSIHGGLDYVIDYGHWQDWRWITGAGTPPTSLNEGDMVTIALNFNGNEIFEKGYSGYYKIHMEIENEDTHTRVARNETDTSRYYSYDEFETPSVYYSKSWMTNESGQHDYINSSTFLTINTSIIVETGTFEGGTQDYEICGGLHYSTSDSEDWGEWLTGTCQYITLSEGTNIVPLNFDIGDFYQKIQDDAYNGTFKVGTGLCERIGYWIGPEVDYITYFTQNYSISVLPLPVISMEIFNDEVIDDGDQLRIDAYVNTSSDEYANNTYELHGCVHYNDSGDWFFAAGNWTIVYLDFGQNTLSLNFSGMEIASFGKDAPYEVWMGLDSLPDHELVVENNYDTQNCALGDFNPPGVLFVQGNTSAGIYDSDYFTVNVSLNVTTPYTYHIGGGVHYIEDRGDWEDWVFVAGTGEEYDLTSDTNISIQFDQGMIRSGLPSDYDNSLAIHIGIENVSSWQHIAHLEYRTPQHYTPSDFAAPAVVIGNVSCNISGDDDLVVNLTYNAVSEDQYNIFGGVHTQSWWFITDTWSQRTLSAGEHMINITFNGGEIFNSMQDGPYKIWLGIENSSNDRLVAETELTTPAWIYTQFEGAASGIRIIRENMDDGTVDYMNTSGSSNYLTVNVSVNVSVGSSGTYWIDGGLHYVEGDFWNWITGYGELIVLAEGENTVPLNFNLGDIYTSGKNGPYEVFIGIRDMTTWEDIDHYEYETQSYTVGSGWAPPIQFGSMPDKDTTCGYINGSFLIINVTLNVSDASYAGLYDLHGGVHYRTDEGWWEHITGTGTWSDLENGINNKTLNFNAGEIKNGLPPGYNDNLFIWLGLSNVSTWDEVTYTEYITESYQKSDFPDAGISIKSVGSDNTGDYLRVNLTVNVTDGNAGEYELHGGVHWVETLYGWEEWRFITGTGTPVQLSVGEYNVSLNFSGGDIYSSGQNGPYMIWLGIENRSTWQQMAHAEYEANYNYDDFNSPTLTINCTDDYYNSTTEYLVVNVTINATGNSLNKDYDIHAGIHWVDTSYGWPEWRFITGFGRTLNVTGNMTISLNFSATAIQSTGENGPYEVWAGISLAEQWEDLAHDEYTTSPYDYTGFAEPAVRIINNGSSITDYANGTDYLTVNITVNTTSSAVGETYFLDGCLHWKDGYNWKWIAWEGTEFTVSSAQNYTIKLDFDGKQLSRAGEEDDWPGGTTLVAWFAVRNTTNWNELSRVDEYETGRSYSPSDFTASPITFNGFITDAPVNTSGEGWPYTHLNVTVPINITTAGNYTIHAGLFDAANSTFIVASEAYISNIYSDDTINLSFNGTKIYKKQYNGTFEFKARIFENITWFECDKIINTTNYYNYTNFTLATPEAIIVGNYSNFTNGNNDLVINVTINISVNTSFELYGDLFNNVSSAYITTARNTTFNTSTGDVVAKLVFNNSAIVNSSASPPYKLGYLRLSMEISSGVWEELDVEKDVYYPNPGGA